MYSRIADRQPRYLSLVPKPKFAGPWPRACQITDLWTTTSETYNFHSEESQFNSMFLYKNLKQSFNGCSNNCFCTRLSNRASTVARTTVSCLNSAHARLLLREPRGIGIRLCLTLAGHLFLKQLLESLFSHRNRCFCQKMSQK